jgi:hypothetical protein
MISRASSFRLLILEPFMQCVDPSEYLLQFRAERPIEAAVSVGKQHRDGDLFVDLAQRLQRRVPLPRRRGFQPFEIVPLAACRS